MPPLIRLLLLHVAAGLTLGGMVAFGLVASAGMLTLFVDEPIAVLLLLWTFGASFSLGMIATRVGLGN